MKLLLRLSSLALVPLLLAAQGLDNSSLTGDYYFVHLLAEVSPTGTVAGAQNLGGTITFDGAGAYTYAGRQGVDAGAPASAAGVGVYEVMSNAFVTLTNPISNTLEIDARLGVDSEVLIGASTSALDGSYDLFVAIKTPDGAKDNGLLTGSYTGATLAFPDGLGDALTTALLLIEADGAGAFTSIRARGHAADAIGDVNFEEETLAATYALGGDGSGTAALGGELTLFNGARDILVSADGNYLIGFGADAGAREIFIGVRNFSDTATDADWNGTYWFSEIIADPAFGSFTSAVGGLSTVGTGVATISERLLANLNNSDFSTVNRYSIEADSTGQLSPVLQLDGLNMGLGAPGGTGAALAPDTAAKGAAVVPRAVIGAQVNPPGADGFFHGIFIGIRVPAFAGGGVFLNPIGVINGASFAPPTFPIAAGAIVSLFGTGMAAGTVVAGTTPLPTTLGGVVVTINGVPAPLFFVSPLQINLQVPFATAGALATIVVANGGVPSNTVLVPLAPTSPGVFSNSLDGLGPGIIVHSLTFAPVTEADPTSPGEFVSILLTGLGALQPPLGDGVAGPVDPLSLTTDPNIEVLFGFEALSGVITFSGAAPLFVGLYQINVIVPDLQVVGAAVPVAIITSNAISDFVTVPVAF